MISIGHAKYFGEPDSAFFRCLRLTAHSLQIVELAMPAECKKGDKIVEVQIAAIEKELYPALRLEFEKNLAECENVPWEFQFAIDVESNILSIYVRLTDKSGRKKGGVNYKIAEITRATECNFYMHIIGE